MTPEEIAALPVFPEPEETGGGTVTTDGGTIVADGRGYVYFITESGHTSYFKVGSEHSLYESSDGESSEVENGGT